MQQLLDAIGTTGKQYGLELHCNKFQLLQVGREYRFLAPDGNLIAPSEVMTYLGAAIYPDGSVRSELNRKLGAAWADFSKLAKLWKHSHLDTAFKIDVYRSVVLTRLLYGLSSAWLNMAEQRRLNGFHCRCLRSILKIKPASFSRVSNNTVLEKAGQPTLMQQLMRHQLGLFGRIVRASGTDPLRSLVFVDGSINLATSRFVRRVGRPRNEWAAMLLRECRKMSTHANHTIYIKSQWEREVYQHCVG